MVLDPRTLEVSPTAPPEGDPVCPHCGYDLTGLLPDAVCPECGLPRRRTRSYVSRYSDQMVNAPIPWIRTLALGCYLLIAGAIVLPVVASVSLFVGLTGSAGTAVLGITAAAAWYAGVWLVTRPRPATEDTLADPRAEWVVSRVAARISQVAWFVAVFAAAVSGSGATSGAGITIVLVSGMIVGVIGVFFLCVYLSNVAYWASDVSLSHSFRACIFAFVLLGSVGGGAFAIGQSFGFSFGGIAVGLFRGLGGLLIAAPIVMFVHALVSMAVMSTWAVRAAATDAARTARLADPTVRKCRKCGYDLTGVPLYTRCPECGTAEPGAPDPRPVRAPRPDQPPIPIDTDA